MQDLDEEIIKLYKRTEKARINRAMSYSWMGRPSMTEM